MVTVDAREAHLVQNCFFVFSAQRSTYLKVYDVCILLGLHARTCSKINSVLVSLLLDILLRQNKKNVEKTV
jgi:hypothetical protein